MKFLSEVLYTQEGFPYRCVEFTDEERNQMTLIKNHSLEFSAPVKESELYRHECSREFSHTLDK
jgi:hypothetical protein